MIGAVIFHNLREKLRVKSEESNCFKGIVKREESNCYKGRGKSEESYSFRGKVPS